MAEQATVIRFREQGKDKLSFWLSDKLDELMFLTLSGVAYTYTYNLATRVNSQLPSLSFASDVVAPSSNRVSYAGTASSTATLTSSNTINWAFITELNTIAKEKRLRPIRGGGKNNYVLVVHPRQERDLKLDPTYQTIVSRSNKMSGKLFEGSIANVDGMVIHSHNKVINTSGLASGSKWGSGGTVDGAQCLMLGAQAGGIATVGNMFWRESDQTDYNNRPGIGIGRKIGMLKPQFLSVYDETSGPGTATRQDFGVISGYTAAAA